MKHLIIAIACSLAALFSPVAAFAATYTVGEVPNTHVADRSQFVSNPDGILTNTTVAQINAVFRALRDSTSVEPMVVVLENIEPNDIDIFATDLFEEWGLGKSDVDNGLLLLVSTGSRKVVIRTGYGLEGALPDITCGRIIREVIIPYFRQGDYNSGVLAAVATMSRILSNPDLAAEFASKESDADFAFSSVDAFSMYLKLCMFGTIIMLIAFILKLMSLKGKSDYDKYNSLKEWKPLMLALTFAGLGMPVVVTIPLLLLLNAWRNHSRKCPNCAGAMKKIDEIHDNEYLSPSQDLEERLGSVDYDVWLCEKCGETDILAYVNGSSPMEVCDNCHTRAAVLKVNRILVQPTANAKGKGVKEYECLNCHHRNRRFYDLEPDGSDALAAIGTAAVLGSALRGGRGGGGFGGGSFGGGFGGGMTGGGGASGGW